MEELHELSEKSKTVNMKDEEIAPDHEDATAIDRVLESTMSKTIQNWMGKGSGNLRMSFKLSYLPFELSYLSFEYHMMSTQSKIPNQ